MSAQMKHTLAALLAAAAIIVPASAEAKGGKGHGGEGGGHEQSHGGGGGGGGEFRGDGGGKHGEMRQARQPQDQAFATRQVFQVRGNGNGKHARPDRFAPAEIFAIERVQEHEAAGRQRWKNERHAERAPRESFERRSNRGKRDVVHYASRQLSDRDFKSDRKFDKQLAKQQRAAYRAEAKQDRQWAKQQRQSLKQAVRVGPGINDRYLADYPRTVGYAAAPVYRMTEVREFRSYPAYTTGYDYAPYYQSYDTNGYAGWANPQGYVGYSPYSAYSPYDVGYSNDGFGGLLGGSQGGLGDILVTLLPLILGDNHGLDGLTGSLGTGLLGSSMPGLTSGYALNDYSAVGYADPVYSYQDPSISQGLFEADENLSGGDDLMSLVGLALGSGLLGDNAGNLGGLGGLLGLGGGLGLGDGLSAPDPVYAYADPYASNTGLLNAFGI
jgi:hypothetical protein